MDKREEDQQAVGFKAEQDIADLIELLKGWQKTDALTNEWEQQCVVTKRGDIK